MLTRNQSIQKLLNPKTIAVIGASDKPGYGMRCMRNILRYHYEGRVYPVNPTKDEVFGLRCYKSVTEIDDHIDLAIIIVKAKLVEGVVDECIASGVSSALIISAGFREYDPENMLPVERRIAQKARESGMRIVGPNCIGLANPGLELWGCSITSLPERAPMGGHAALISQSGATGFGPLLLAALDRGVGFKYIVSTGNETDLSLCDVADYCIEDEDVKTISLYIEGVQSMDDFVELAKKAKKLGKNVIVMKIGESQIGARAAASHTASLTGDMTVFNALLKQYGVIKAQDYDEFIELTQMTQMKKPAGKRFCVLSGSGGIAGFTGDQLGVHGFDVPKFSEKTQQRIDEFLKGFGSPRNPLDLTGSLRKPDIIEIVKAVEENEDIDAYVFSTHGSAADFDNIIEAIHSTQKPVYWIWTGSIHQDGIDRVVAEHLPLSTSIEKFARMMGKMFAADAQEYPSMTTQSSVICSEDLGAFSGYLNENSSKAIVRSIGVHTPFSIRADVDEDAYQLIPNGMKDKKYALKICSATIIHKSDIGGVILNVRGASEFAEAQAKLKTISEAHSGEIDAILVEEMADDGLDMVVGIRSDAMFGDIVMIGLGGIYTELFKMISCRVLPICEKDVNDMIEEISGLSKLFDGYRGHCGYDRHAFIDAVVKMCGFVTCNKEKIDLLEINPLRVMEKEKGIAALDCVIKFHD